MGRAEFQEALRAAFPKVTKDDFASADGKPEKLVEVVAKAEGISESDAKDKIADIRSKTM